jgi:hypothetical protein
MAVAQTKATQFKLCSGAPPEKAGPGDYHCQHAPRAAPGFMLLHMSGAVSPAPADMRLRASASHARHVVSCASSPY